MRKEEIAKKKERERDGYETVCGMYTCKKIVKNWESIQAKIQVLDYHKGLIRSL